MTISLSDDERRAIVVAEEIADVTIRDCLIDDEHGRIAFVVKAGEVGKAIGRDGETVARIEDRLGRDVTLVEDAPTPEGFVANALAPAAVYDVTIEERDEKRVAFADVDEADTGAAIGTEGRTIELARRLAGRHFEIDDIQLA
ncbi:Transcription elongation factor [Halorhabdus sp. SVX81]|uniref:NusA-like transcription termination signal-binding factor n=1 Tax=Halorhabdus sp. SVX81 TaxID=2978283 RepID=UPI0023DAA55E|nr:NusA-like transcription termination signal-binding factor [Halorhabdus sp. SVX81]WEL16998.1 Transcription elongation factor [Halorhabdus sp. SVX81]